MFAFQCVGVMAMGSRVQGLVPEFGFVWVYGFRFRVFSVLRFVVWDSGCRVLELGVWGLGFQGSGLRV